MNRVSRLLHKVRFSSHQRRILAYSHRYVITTDDLTKKEDTDPQTYTSKKSEAEYAQMIEDLVGDFDAVENETDRRIFYEVTGW